MKSLNRQQSNASKPDRGINLVIAGAGTGKTSTMIAKIRNVIESEIASPGEILILTFSRKAAEEIRNRLEKDSGIEFRSLFAGTFHSFALKLLRDNPEDYLRHAGFSKFPSIIGNDEKIKILEKLISETMEEYLGLPVDVVLYLLEKFKTLHRSSVKKLEAGGHNIKIRELQEKFISYKCENSLIEFEEIIEHAVELLDSSPQLRERNRDIYRYIFVDEFQDTSENNFSLLKLLMGERESNLFMVGDDYQSIYRFRNSRVEYMINIRKFLPGAVIHKLVMNYRSKSEIVKLTNRFIKRNRFQTSKRIVSGRGKGGIIRCYPVSDLNEESQIVKRIATESDATVSIAVLFRNNYQGEILRNTTNLDGRVLFLTMHGSKGLEFDRVIIAGIADHVIPDRNSELEEERRLFYVALTRAKDELHLLYHKNIDGTLPRFMRELGYRNR